MLVALLVLAPGCATSHGGERVATSTVPFKADPLPVNSHPMNNVTKGGFSLGVDIRKPPKDLSSAPLAFEVAISNPGHETFSWPDPCPAYIVTTSESATNYFVTEQRLSCEGLRPLQPGDEQAFAMEFVEGIRPGGQRLAFEFDDARVRGGQVIAGSRKFNIPATPR